MKVAFPIWDMTTVNGGGVSRYGVNLIRCLRKEYPDNDYYVFQKYDNPVGEFSDLSPELFKLSYLSKIPFLRRSIYSNFHSQRLPIILDGRGVKIYHKISQFLKIDKWSSRCKSVMTIYDITPLVLPLEYPRYWIDKHRQIQNDIKKVDAVICISNRTREDLIGVFGIDSSKIHVIYLGINDEFELDEQVSIDRRERYILFVGVHGARKNIIGLLKALRFVINYDPTIKLVIVGSFTKYTAIVKETIVDLKLHNHVKLAGSLSDQALANLYRKALCLVLPSFYEGFGLPALEAMACWTPVVVSQAGALPEIVGNAGIYFDPNNVDEIADKIITVIRDTKTSTNLSIIGKERSKAFSWQIMARETQKIYDGLL